MKKVIYWIGIYSICAVSSDYVDEVLSGLGRRLHKWAIAATDELNKKKERRSVNIGDGTVGEPINRIGF